MVYPMYSIRDNLTSYGVPFCCDNDAQAMRYLKQAISQPNSVYAVSPKDFDLYYVATFDTSSGEVKSDVVRYICNCYDVKENV